LAALTSLVGQAVADVFYSEAGQAMREGTLPDLAANIVGRLFALGLTPAVILLLAGPDVFQWAFGERWRDAGLVAGLLAPWFLMVLAGSSITRAFALARANRAALMNEALLFV